MEILTDWRQKKKVKDQYPTIQLFFTVLNYENKINIFIQKINVNHTFMYLVL